MTAPMLGLLLGGMLTLIVGAEALVRGAAGLALRFGVSSLVVGLTVVAFATSSPELAVTLSSAFRGAPDLAVGNVVGSNIFNVLVILGLSAVVAPLAVSRQLVILDVPVMIGVSLIAFFFALDGAIGRTEGIVLFSGIVAYTVFLVRLGRRSMAGVEQPGTPRRIDPLTLQVVLVAVGVGMLVLGSRWMLAGAVSIARYFGLSDLIIGLTVLAVGTSLPELASSVVAAARGERDIAVGNAVGSNIFNLLMVLGSTAAFGPTVVPVAPAALRFDLPVMLAVALACLPIFFTGHRIGRWEGALFLAYYAAYTTFLVLEATRHDAAVRMLGHLMAFALPITALTLLVLAWRYWRRKA